jgi:6-phosphogluconolactonase
MNGMMPNIYKFNIGNDFISKASHAIENFIVEQGSKPLRIALSGGASPKAVYEKLAKSEAIDWNQIELFMVDERADHSNERMMREVLISELPNLKAFHPLTEASENQLHELSRPFFDLVLLGLGKDGHTASLFPYGPELEEVEKLVVHSKSPTPPTDRLSLTYPAIMSSRKIIFLIRGANKKEIIQKWLEEDSSEEEIPAKAILDHQNVEIYYDYSS